MAAIYSNGGNRWNILGFNLTKIDALSSVYKISMVVAPLTFGFIRYLRRAATLLTKGSYAILTKGSYAIYLRRAATLLTKGSYATYEGQLRYLRRAATLYLYEGQLHYTYTKGSYAILTKGSYAILTKGSYAILTKGSYATYEGQLRYLRRVAIFGILR